MTSRNDAAADAHPQEHRSPDDGAPTQPIAEAFTALRSELLGVLRRRVGSAAVAEDLVQEVFLRALTLEDPPRHLRGWLHGVARHVAVDHLRRGGAPEPLHGEPPDDDPAGDDTEAEQRLAGALAGMVAELPPLYRDTLQALDFEGLDQATLARREGVGLSAIKSRASRGRRMLREAVLACCRVELSVRGEVLDAEPRHTGRCRDDTCGP